MESSQTRTLWISIGAALLAIFLLYSWMQEQRSQAAAEFGARDRVVVATRDIPEMSDIEDSMLEVQDLPKNFIQPKAISAPEMAHGRITAVPIKKGEQIVETKLLEPGPQTGLSSEVSPGKRAITIPIDDNRGVSKLLKPGDRIDLVAALDYGRGAETKREVRTIMQDVVILATGLNIANKIPRRVVDEGTGKATIYNLDIDTKFSNIVIEAKPDEIQVLIYILSTAPGNLFAVLRHPNDRIVQPTKNTTVDDVLQKAMVRAPAAQPAPPAPPPPPPPAPKKPKRTGNFQEL